MICRKSDGLCMAVAVAATVPAKGKKGLVSSVIYCTKPVEEKISEIASWEKFEQDRIKVTSGKLGTLATPSPSCTTRAMSLSLGPTTTTTYPIDLAWKMGRFGAFVGYVIYAFYSSF